MTPITIKDSTGTDRLFSIIRQPSGGESGILLYQPSGEGMNRTAAAKIEVSTKIGNGKTSPVVTVTVPYGAVINGNFQKAGQVSRVVTAQLPNVAPEITRDDAEAYCRHLLSNAQIIALFQNGVVS